MRLCSGDVAVVTGAGSGIGLALAQAFCARGLAVVMADIRTDVLEASADTLREAGGKVETVVTDVSVVESVERLAKRTVEVYGRVDVVCNNAGVSLPPAAAWTVTEPTWRWSIDVGLLGVVHGVRAFVPLMIERGRGHVLNTASVGGLVPVPGLAPYSAVKHAVVGLTETLAEELSEVAPGVGASVLCPGFVATDLVRSSRETAPAGIGAIVPDRMGERTPTTPRSEPTVTVDAVAEAALAGIEAGTLRIVTHRDSVPLVRRQLVSVEGDLPD